MVHRYDSGTKHQRYSFDALLDCVFVSMHTCVSMVRSDEFGAKHHRYSDVLLDYGFFQLNIDCICQAVKVYQMALDIRLAVFGGNNLYVAIAHEDLAYCAYVHEYSSGKFHDARYYYYYYYYYYT